MEVVLSEWREGVRTIALMDALRDFSGLGLSKAKAVVDRFVAGEEVVVSVPEERVESFINAAFELGALVKPYRE